jgi:bis(5'-nucleosidyl)-tetraphosphatase
MSELKACGVLVVRCDASSPETPRDFLLMRHADRWDLPKGHVDPGETEETETALRELHEETGIPADAIELDPVFRWSTRYPVTSKRTAGETWQKTVVIFLGRLLRDVRISTTEHHGYEWFPWQPPHAIQSRTIDPLLAAVEEHLA